MADKSFGVKELNLLNASGTPTVTSPNNLNLNANTVAISTSCTIGNNLTVTSTTNSANLNVTGIGTLTRGFATDLSVSGISTISQPSNANPHSLWDVVNNSSSSYRFTGPGVVSTDDNPNIYLVRGQRYIFKINASSHPFYIKTEAGTGTGNQYTDGVTGNGAQSGNITFNVQHDAPPQLKYQCSSHGSMVGNIYIVGGPQVISGVVTATSFSGSGANLTNLPAQATIANNADNRIITGGSGVNLNAESNVLYDGTNFGIGKSPSRTLDVQGKIRSSDSVCFGDNSSTPSEGAAIHRPAASSLAFVTNNTERVRITSGGDIGLGESNPNKTGYASPIVSIGYNTSNNYSVLELLGNQTSNNSIANIVAYNVGGSSRIATINFQRSGANNSGLISFETYASGSSSERLRILNDGRITTNGLDGATDITTTGTADTYDGMVFGTPPLRITRTSGCPVFLNRNGSGGNIQEWRYGGNIVGYVSNNANSFPSDRNFKKNITNLSLGLDLVNKLQPVSYNYKFDADSDPVMYGLVAQDFEKALSEVGVTQNAAAILKYEATDDEKQSDYFLDYSKLTPILINAVKELTTKIETLEAKVAALEGS